MKSLVIYSSQTGFTKKYAEWIAEELGGEALAYETAKDKDADYFNAFDTIIYGGWANAGRIVKSEWFLAKTSAWKNKKVALYCVGAAKPDDERMANTLDKLLSDEQKTFIKTFYFIGGVNYEKMKLSHKFAMKLYADMLKKNKDPEIREYGKVISESFDSSDRKYIKPLIEYIGK